MGHSKLDRPLYSLIVPTYRRPDVLSRCLQHIEQLDYPRESLEVLVYDNGSPDHVSDLIETFLARIPVVYTLNEPGHGMGYSLKKGVRDCRGERIVELNDDALIPSDFLNRLNRVFDSAPSIGIVGVRAIEDGYFSHPNQSIGVIDSYGCEVVGNFDVPTNGPIPVEHVYGFCYAYTRELVRCGGVHDSILLSQDFSSGNRLETDQCLSAVKLGFKVIYDGSIAVKHLAKPRVDISEKSPRWRMNHERNTLYLFLKHFGVFGNRFLAIRFGLRNLGIRSLLLNPSRINFTDFCASVNSRLAALYYYTKYLISR